MIAIARKGTCRAVSQLIQHSICFLSSILTNHRYIGVYSVAWANELCAFTRRSMVFGIIFNFTRVLRYRRCVGRKPMILST